MKFKQKKGDVFQVMFLLTLLFAVALVGLLTLVLTTSINNFWQESGFLNDSQTAQEAIDKVEKIAPRTTDYAIFFLFVGMIIGVTIAAVRTDFNAITIILFILLTLIAIVISAGYVNLYRGLAESPNILAVSEQLILSDYLFSKYTPLFTAVLCALIMILMYAKTGGEIIR
jgi:hypothetical protein